MSTSHFGPESLEDAAVDYIVRNLDLYDVLCSVNVRENDFDCLKKYEIYVSKIKRIRLKYVSIRSQILSWDDYLISYI